MTVVAAIFDIEGTLCPISFVKDKLYPYALERAAHDVPKVQFPTVPSDNEEDIAYYLGKFPAEYRGSAETLLEHMKYLTEHDVKSSYLKALQGFLWKRGYEQGDLKVELFPDVVPALQKLRHAEDLYIYSSGSVMAQKLLFSHTEQGDLTSLFHGYFDTVNAGPKTESKSYNVIASAVGAEPRDIMFYSDNPKEIEAADEAGYQTTFVTRPGNPEFPDFSPPGHKDTIIRSEARPT